MNRKRTISGKDIFGYLFLGISTVMLLRSLMLCFSNDIWYDELFTVGMIEHSYGDLIAFTARDVHPPLYYCIVKIFVDLCKLISVQADPVVIAKIVSVLPYFVLLVYSVTLIRKRFGIFTGGMFLFYSIAMPQLSSYTVEVRMYSFALLFVTAAFLHACEVVSCCADREIAERSKPESGGMDSVWNGVHTGSDESGRSGIADRKSGKLENRSTRRLHWIALVLYGLAAAYTQYFACVAVIMVYFYVLVVFLLKDRKRIKEWFLCVAVSVIGYVPWLYALIGQITTVNENYWILPLTWRSLGGCVKFMMKPAFTNELFNTVLAVVMFALYILVFACVGVDAYKNSKLCHYGRENPFAFMLAGISVLAGLVLFGFAASFLMRPIFVYRYMIPALGCFWLSFAVGLDWLIVMMAELCKLKKCQFPFVRTLPFVAVIFILLIGLRDYRAFMGEEEYKTLLMKQTEEALSSIAPGDSVIYNFDQVQAVTSYYLDKELRSYLWCGTPETLIQDIIRDYDTVEETEEIKKWCEEGRNVWFIGSFNSRDDIVAEWEAAGLQVEETGSYLLERYWFNLYKIF